MVEYPNMKKTGIIRTAACLLLCALLLASLASCASWDNFYNAFISKKETPARVVRIAVFEPLTGADAAEAADEVRGIALANSMIPVVKGATIELVYFDNKSDPDAAKLTAAEIVRDETISMVIGSYGNMITVASADIFEEAGLPAVNPASSNPLVSNTTSFVCASVIDAFPARAAAEFVVNELGQTETAAMYSSSDELSKIRAQEYSRWCEQTYKITDVPVIAINEGSDPYFIVKALENAGTKAVYLPAGTSVSETVIAKAEEMGLKIEWIGGDAWKNIGISGVYYTGGYDPFGSITEMSGTFTEAYRSKYGSSSFPSEQAALGFDAYLIAAAAIDATDDQESREDIAAALMEVADLEGSTGYISISSNGSPVKSVQIFRTEDGEDEHVFTAFGPQTEPAEEEPGTAASGGR
ncbi:MAG: ABC transporter substrate-binding protein [Firmicutes bacterium]|nr:ABC transporter substrate-binding protein [Bacillota bacterium]